MAEVSHIDDDARQQRRAQRQALETLLNFKHGAVYPLFHIDDASFIFGTINSIAGVLAVEATSDGGVSDTVTASALEGIALLAAIGQFAQEAKA